jgi:8-oxo-dGTP pyrophosphatase MutT (NUDIX family)
MRNGPRMKRSAKQTSNQALNAHVIEQAGALCLQTRGDERHILLVGSRRNGRWGLPKGHLDDGEASHVAAAREAFEEAGVRGPASDDIVGSFLYSKDSSANRYRVIVHALAVVSIEDIYPEQGVRSRQWFTLSEAVSVVGHDGLRDLLRTLL